MCMHIPWPSSLAAIASHHCAVQVHWSVCFIPIACMGLGDAICPAVGHTDRVMVNHSR
jgi:hypothetical protein